MELIYNNFDGLDISFQGALPETILKELSQAREEAQTERSEVYKNLGPEGLRVAVAETGARGGYRYRFDTGLDGEVWFVVHSTNSKNWNLRVSVKSLSLALYGYQGVKERILKRLDALGAFGNSQRDEKTGKTFNRPIERISRVDYCFDFVFNEAFTPTPSNFVAHQRSKKHIYGEKSQLNSYSSLNGDAVNTIRIGEMPNRQIALYNKTKEIHARTKNYWWDIWGIEKEAFKATSREIWRVEVRAGKDELDKWSLKRFKDFENKIGDVMKGTLQAIRYTEPLKCDSNRSRWPMHPIWESSLKHSNKALEPYISNVRREKIIEDYRENIISSYEERIIGNYAGLFALCIPIEENSLEGMHILNRRINERIGIMGEKFLKKTQKAEERFHSLVDVNSQKT